jgi:hypothetical protein
LYEIEHLLVYVIAEFSRWFLFDPICARLLSLDFDMTTINVLLTVASDLSWNVFTLTAYSFFIKQLSESLGCSAYHRYTLFTEFTAHLKHEL